MKESKEYSDLKLRGTCSPVFKKIEKIVHALPMLSTVHLIPRGMAHPRTIGLLITTVDGGKADIYLRKGYDMEFIRHGLDQVDSSAYWKRKKQILENLEKHDI